VCGSTLGALPMLRGEVRKGKKSNWRFAQMLMSWPHFLPFRIAFVLDACSNAPHNTLRLHLYTMKLFSVEEANALLQEIKRQWREIDAARATLRRLAPEAKRASEQTGGGGSIYGLEYINALTNLMASAQQIVDLGVEIKDFEK